MMAATTTNSTVPGASELNVALLEAIAALTALDETALEGLEASLSGLIERVDTRSLLDDGAAELPEIAARHRLLGTLLASTELNLSVLERLHGRHATGETPWAL